MNEKQTILLVDDNKNDLLLMQMALKSAGFVNPLKEAHNGEEAIAFFEKLLQRNDKASMLPGLVLLDLNMPRKNGFEVLRWIRTKPEIRHLPVIILTTSTLVGDIDRAYYLGANSFLSKPSDLNDLIKMLECLRQWLKYNYFPSLQGWAQEPSNLSEEEREFQLR